MFQEQRVLSRVEIQAGGSDISHPVSAPILLTGNRSCFTSQAGFLVYRQRAPAEADALVRRSYSQLLYTARVTYQGLDWLLSALLRC